MRYVDEFRQPELITRLSEEIRRLADPERHYRIMEVCGGHTHAIYRFGLKDLLPCEYRTDSRARLPGLRAADGPNRRRACPWPQQPDVIFTAFGDMMRVPGTHGSPLEYKARGTDVRIVYSPSDALKLAQANPDKHVMFFAIGFETTAPSTALTLMRAQEPKASGIFRCSAITSRSFRQSARFSIRPTCGSTHSSARATFPPSSAAGRTSGSRSKRGQADRRLRASSRSICCSRS